MNRIYCFLVTVTLVCVAFPTAGSSDFAWEPLFNGRNLDGWYTFLAINGKNKDPQGVFKVEGGMIHVLDVPVTSEKQEFGYLGTVNEYGNCRIRAEFKWGAKRFLPYNEDKRDSGFLYHCVGPDRVWPRALEFQIQESDVGDLWILGGATISTNIETEGFPMYSLPRSVPRTQSRGRIIKSGDFEDRRDWNQIEIILDGDRVTHLVNGRVVMRAWDLKQPDPQDPTKLIPLDHGRLLLQAEGAEVWFRNIAIRKLK